MNLLLLLFYTYLLSLYSFITRMFSGAQKKKKIANNNYFLCLFMTPSRHKNSGKVTTQLFIQLIIFIVVARKIILFVSPPSDFVSHLLFISPSKNDYTSLGIFEAGRISHTSPFYTDYIQRKPLYFCNVCRFCC